MSAWRVMPALVNNLAIAELIQDWLARRGLYR